MLLAERVRCASGPGETQLQSKQQRAFSTDLRIVDCIALHPPHTSLIAMDCRKICGWYMHLSARRESAWRDHRNSQLQGFREHAFTGQKRVSMARPSEQSFTRPPGGARPFAEVRGGEPISTYTACHSGRYATNFYIRGRVD